MNKLCPFSSLKETIPFVSEDPGKEFGVFLMTTETRSQQVFATLQHFFAQNPGNLWIGTSCFYNLNGVSSFSEDTIKGILIIDYSVRTIKFWKEASKIIIESKKRKEAISEFKALINKHKFGFFAGGSTFENLEDEINNGTSWLSSYRRFRRIQKIFREGNFFHLPLDFCNIEAHAKISAALKEKNWKPCVIYIANITCWLNEEQQKRFEESIRHYADEQTPLIFSTSHCYEGPQSIFQLKNASLSQALLEPNGKIADFPLHEAEVISPQADDPLLEELNKLSRKKVIHSLEDLTNLDNEELALFIGKVVERNWVLPHLFKYMLASKRLSLPNDIALCETLVQALRNEQLEVFELMMKVLPEAFFQQIDKKQKALILDLALKQRGCTCLEISLSRIKDSDLLIEPLNHAVSQENSKRVAILLEHGADPNGASRNMTPLQRALMTTHISLEIVEMLLKAHADPNFVFKEIEGDCNLPIVIAAVAQSQEAVDLLKKYGATTEMLYEGVPLLDYLSELGISL